MKLKSAGAFIAASLLMTAGNANANLLFDIYAGATAGFGGATMLVKHDNETNTAQSYGAVFGIDIPVLRVEAEYDFLKHQDIDMNVGMLNAYLKMPSLLVSPYLGVGAGMIFGGNAPHGVDIEQTAAYQAMLGVTFDVPVMPIKIDIEARALYAQDIIKADDKPDVLHYDARLKLRYIF